MKIVIFASNNVCGRARLQNIMSCKVRQRRPPLTEIRDIFFIMEQEIWKDIPGYVGLYQVSNIGRIKSISHYVDDKGGKRLIKEKIKQYGIVDGYYRVQLNKNGLKKLCLVHRLVAMAFIPNPQQLPVINHKNEIRTDNRVENLEWCTVGYNNCYGNAILRRKKTRGKRIVQKSLDGKIIKIYDCVNDACRTFNVGVWYAANGRQKTAYGFKWEYL